MNHMNKRLQSQRHSEKKSRECRRRLTSAATDGGELGGGCDHSCTACDLGAVSSREIAVVLSHEGDGVAVLHLRVFSGKSRDRRQRAGRQGPNLAGLALGGHDADAVVLTNVATREGASIG